MVWLVFSPSYKSRKAVWYTTVYQKIPRLLQIAEYLRTHEVVEKNNTASKPISKNK